MCLVVCPKGASLLAQPLSQFSRTQDSGLHFNGELFIRTSAIHPPAPEIDRETYKLSSDYLGRTFESLTEHLMEERGLNQECLSFPFWGGKKKRKKLKFILSDLSPDVLSNLHPLSQKASVPIKPGQKSQSFLLLYLNSNARKDFREYLSTPGSSFYREKTESQRVTCPRSHKILKQGLEVYFGPIIISFLPHQLYQLIFIEHLSTFYV